MKTFEIKNSCLAKTSVEYESNFRVITVSRKIFYEAVSKCKYEFGENGQF